MPRLYRIGMALGLVALVAGASCRPTTAEPPQLPPSPTPIVTPAPGLDEGTGGGLVPRLAGPAADPTPELPSPRTRVVVPSHQTCKRELGRLLPRDAAGGFTFLGIGRGESMARLAAVEAGGFHRSEAESSEDGAIFRGQVFGVPAMVVVWPSQDRGEVDGIELVFPGGISWTGPTPESVLSARGFLTCLRRVFGEESRHGVLEWQEYHQWKATRGWSLEFEYIEDASFGGNLRLF